MHEVVVFSGGGDIRDPWHPFADTSAALADVLGGAGLDVVVVDAVERMPSARLIVLNAGSGGTVPPAERALQRRVAAHLGSGGALLAVHAAASLFADWSEWRAWLGGRWIEGVSMHPERTPFDVLVPATAHPITAGVAGFRLDDEQYSDLDLEPGLEPLAEHELGGRRHPLVWGREHRGARLVYDALGHDRVSFAHPAHRRLLENAARWLLD